VIFSTLLPSSPFAVFDAPHFSVVLCLRLLVSPLFHPRHFAPHLPPAEPADFFLLVFFNGPLFPNVRAVGLRPSYPPPSLSLTLPSDILLLSVAPISLFPRVYCIFFFLSFWAMYISRQKKQLFSAQGKILCFPMS